MDKAKVAPRYRLLRVTQLAELLSISRSRAYELVREGHFTTLKVGGCLRVTYESYIAFIERQISIYEASLE